MAPLAHTLALLAMTVATAAIEEVPLDMAKNSFDDQYRGCGPAMTAALPALKHSELQQNPLFAQSWAEAVAAWRIRGSRVSPLSSPAQAIALMAYTMREQYEKFDAAVRVAGSSHQEYRDSFHFKTLHFLLTQALDRLRDVQGHHCYCAFLGVHNVRFKAQPGDTVRFGQFVSMSHCKQTNVLGMDTVLWVQTCHGTNIQGVSFDPDKKQVLIPPFETFEVTGVTQESGVSHIHLKSTGTHSNHNCEWLRGGSVPRAPSYLGGLLLATAALAVATGTL